MSVSNREVFTIKREKKKNSDVNWRPISRGIGIEIILFFALLSFFVGRSFPVTEKKILWGCSEMVLFTDCKKMREFEIEMVIHYK